MRKIIAAFVFCGLCVFGVNLEEVNACQDLRNHPEEFERWFQERVAPVPATLVAITPLDNPSKQTDYIIKSYASDTGVFYKHFSVDGECYPVSDKDYFNPEKVKKLVKEKKLKVREKIVD